MNIKVTQKHIDNGIRRICSECPVALALREQLPSVKIIVIESVIKLLVKDQWYNYPYPKEVFDFIKKFDGNIPVIPFEFELDIPEELINVNG